MLTGTTNSISSTGTTTISGTTSTVIKGGTSTGTLTLQDGNVGTGATAGSTITIAGSGVPVSGAQTVFQTTTNATTSQVTTRIGTSATAVASTAVMQSGLNSFSVDSVTGSTLSGNFAARGSQITLGAADGSSTVTIPGIATPAGGQRFVTTDSSGRIGYSPNTINDYTSALQQVSNQVSSAGAVAAALSSIPNLTNGSSRYGCGVGTGAFGSAWAGAAGCVAKVSNNVWVNGALSFTPAITTAFGSTPTVAGRLGVFWQF